MENIKYELDVTPEEYNHIAQALSFYILDNDRFVEKGMEEYSEKERQEQIEFSWELERLLANIESQITRQMEEDD
jgi:hypothetical protein